MANLRNILRILEDAFAAKKGGLRAIGGHAGSSPQIANDIYARFLQMTHRTERRVARLNATTGIARCASESDEGVQIDSEDEFRSYLTALGLDSTVVVDGIQNLDFERQVDLVSTWRAAWQTLGQVNIVVCGDHWSPSAFIRRWNREHHAVSPPFSGTSMWVRDGYDLHDIGERTQRFLAGASDRVRAAAIAAIFATTGGDVRLVDWLVEQMATSLRGSVTESVRALERFLLALPDENFEVASDFAARIEPSSRMMDILIAVVSYGQLALSHDDADCDELRLMGLLSAPEGVPGRRVLWRPASPAMRKILIDWLRNRTIAGDIVGHVALPSFAELVPERLPATSSAHELVCAIENCLRNLLLTVLADAGTESALRRVPRMTTKAGGDRDIHESVRQLRSQEEQKVPSLLVTLQLTTFLDPNDIRNVVTKLFSEKFAGVFASQSEFEQKFDEFNRFRQAVAHNKVLSLSAIDDLESLANYFNLRVAMAASASLERRADSRREATCPVTLTLIETVPIDGDRARVRCRVETTSAEAHSVVVQVVFESPSGPSSRFGNPVEVSCHKPREVHVLIPWNSAAGTLPNPVLSVKAGTG